MTRETLVTLAQQAAQASGAIQVILFGSAARGELRKDSDIDLLFILPDDIHLTKAMTKAQRALFPRTMPFDLVPMHVANWHKKDSVLARAVAKEGIVLYG